MKTNQLDSNGFPHGLFIYEGYKERYNWVHGRHVGYWVIHSSTTNKICDKFYYIL